MFGMAFYGTQGSLVNTGGGDCFIYDMRGKLLDTIKGSASQTPHFQNFIDAIRGEATAHADAQIAHDSVMLCHYGNMAHRTGQTLHIDPETGHPTDAPAAMALWQREYRDGWEPKV